MPGHPYRHVVNELTQPPESPRKHGQLIVSVVLVTALVTAASYLVPADYAATAVGLVFLSATWFLVLRKDGDVVREHGLGLGGVLLPEELRLGVVVKEALVAFAWAAGVFALIAVPFAVGYARWFHVRHAFDFHAALPSAEHVAAQLLVIALPEEAFFRGYVQTELDRVFPRRTHALTMPIGVSILVTSAIFAIGHFLTITSPARLAVFFPSLLFGSLRTRTRGVGAGILLHAACNLLSASLAHGYGLRHP